MDRMAWNRLHTCHALVVLATFGILGSPGATRAEPGAAAAQPQCVPERGDPYVGAVPPNLRLVPACPGARVLGKNEFHWVFNGNVVLKGTLRATFAEEGGGISVQPDSASRRQLPGAVNPFVQLHDADGNSVLRIPDPGSDEEVCLEAPGTVAFSQLSVINDGTDRSGNWVSEYKVIALGKWRKCRDR